MAAGMAIVGGVKAAGAIKGARDEKKAAQAQQGIDAENIARMKEENKETIKRTEERQQEIEASGRTAAAASGFAKGSSKQSYMDSLQKTHQSDLDWLKKSAESNVSIAESESAMRYDISRRRSGTNLIAGLGDAAAAGIGSYGRFQSTGNWWS